MRTEAGETLAAAAAKAGITEMNPSVEKERLNLDRDFIVGQQEAAARREADLLIKWKKQQSSQQNASNRVQPISGWLTQYRGR